MSNEELERAIQVAARSIASVALGILAADQHRWSNRPCATCQKVGAVLGVRFGCYAPTEQGGGGAQ